MAHPTKVKLFVPWAKAMVAGATVDKPSYPGTKLKASKTNSRNSKIRRRRRKRKKRKLKHA